MSSRYGLLFSGFYLLVLIRQAHGGSLLVELADVSKTSTNDIRATMPERRTDEAMQIESNLHSKMDYADEVPIAQLLQDTLGNLSPASLVMLIFRVN